MLNMLLFVPYSTATLKNPECSYVPLLTGPVLHTSSRTGHLLQEAFQSRAGWWKALLMVHLRTQQETGKNAFDVILHDCCLKAHVTLFPHRCSLTPSPSFSLSATEPTSLKPLACSRYASSQRKTPQFGCVVASTQTARLTVMAPTRRTSSCPLLSTHKPPLEKGGGDVFELKIDEKRRM